MAWTSGADGFGKARLKQFQTLLQSKIPDLQDSFKNDSTLAFLTSTYSALDDSSVLRGDYEGMWDITKGGYLRIYVSSGGHREGIDLTEKDFYIDRTTPGAKQRFWNAAISCIFHEKAFSIVHADTQSQVKEDAYMTIMDWLAFDVFSPDSVWKMFVPSNCYDFQGGQDAHYDTKIANAGKIFANSGPGGSAIMLGIQAIITGFS